MFTRQYLTQIVDSAPGYSVLTLYSNRQIKVKHYMVQDKVIWTREGNYKGKSLEGIR